MNIDLTALREKIAAASEPNTTLIDDLHTLATALLDTDTAASLDISLRAIADARTIGYRQGESQALLNLGMGLSKQRKYDEAIVAYSQALAIQEALYNKHSIAVVHSKMGNVKLRNNKYVDALEHYNKAIELLQNTDDEVILANVYTNSGITHGMLANYPVALKSHLQALKIYERLDDEARIAASCTNIGVIYYELQNYEEALKVYNRALNVRRQSGDEMEESVLLVNIGNVYQGQKRYTEALEVNQKALGLREKKGDKERIASSYSNIGNIYKSIHEGAIALDYFNIARDIFESLNDKRGLGYIYANLGELYFELHEFTNAHYYLENALYLANETGLKNQAKDANKFLASLYAHEHKYMEAYKYHIVFSHLDKEISNAETSGQMAQMTMRYEIEQKEKDAETERLRHVELQKAYDLLEVEKQRADDLLLNILPEEVSQELKQYGKTKARSYKEVTVLFADIKGFTKISELLSAEEIVNGIDEYFEVFDLIVEKHNIEKIKTIGDAYLCVSGLPITIPNHAEKMILVAKDFVKAVANLKDKLTQEGKQTFEFRIGVHSGPVVAGVVGIKKFAYDIWGDTVNTSSRMQSNSEPNRINISERTYLLIKDIFDCEYRGEIEAKNKGKLKMYFVN